MTAIPPDARPLRVLSLGAGVQSTAVALMSAHGELPRFDACIFADTGWEPADVYAHFDRLKAHLEDRGIPTYVVSAGNIRDDHANPEGEHLFIRNPRLRPEFMGKQRSFIPFFTLGDGGQGRTLGDDGELPIEVSERQSSPPLRKGKTRRTCTKTYKIEPVEKKIRELLGLKPGARWPVGSVVVEQSFGISWDEVQRMSSPSHDCISHAYPLVDRRMTRDDCHTWLAEHGWTAPRSACIGCPFHRNDEWRRMRDEAPDEWADAIDFDHTVRQRQADGLMTLQSVPFLHDSRVPLDEADIDDVKAEGTQLSFGIECKGFCGT